ncbi:MAG: hypothetical protein ABI980_13840 [Nitrospirota bacterium]
MRHSAMVMVMLVLVMGGAAGCSISDRATDFSGLKGMDGDKLTHINTRNYAVHLFVSQPLIGDATLQNTVKDFTKDAKATGATKVRIVQSSETYLWWIFPPFSLILTPVTTDVAGDAIP